MTDTGDVWRRLGYRVGMKDAAKLVCERCAKGSGVERYTDRCGYLWWHDALACQAYAIHEALYQQEQADAEKQDEQ